MIVVSLNLLPFLKIPINSKLFGENKTYRGFVVMPILTVIALHISIFFEKMTTISSGIQNYDTLSLGIALGLAYCFFELPNSLWKRSKGINAGKLSSDKKILHTIVDQSDSGFGLILVYYVLCGVSVPHLIAFMVVGVCIHILINLVLYFLKIRKEPF